MSETSDRRRNRKLEKYLKLPYSVRLMVIQRMRGPDRFQFSSTSELCKDESAPPFQDVYGLELYGYSLIHWVIYVTFDEYEHHENRKKCYSLIIRNHKNKKHVICQNAKKEQLWRTELHSSTNIYQCALLHFKSILKYNANCVKKLVICGKHLSKFDFGVKTLAAVEELSLEGDVDFRQFLPWIGHPLRKLRVQTGEEVEPIANIRQIYHVTDSLMIPFFKLDGKQFRKLEAVRVRLFIENLTVDDLFDFIDRWRNGEIMKVKGNYQFEYLNGTFDHVQLRKLLKIKENQGITVILKPSYKSDRESALSWYKSALHFQWEYGKTVLQLASL